MIKGIHKQWKQPISFTFSNGSTKSGNLKEMIVNNIKECQKIGLKVVGSVCDQGTTNTRAINDLLKETEEYCVQNGWDRHKYFGFLVNGQEIVPLYDVPHLLKGIRNNLLEKDLHFKIQIVDKIAKWEHIEHFYEVDMSDDTRLCPHLTDAHIYRDKMNKMKMSLAAQVFSRRVGSLVKRLTQWETNNVPVLPKVSEDTAELLLFMDELFDSLNGNSKTAPYSKPMKGGVTKESGHEDCWIWAIDTLSTMKFYCLKKKKYVFVPTVKFFIHTLRGFLYLKTVLLENRKFSYFLPRTLKQDALENFFSCLRSHGIRNTSPTIPHFVTSFKALLVNNFMTQHSPVANCEEDGVTEALDNLRCFVTGESVAGITSLIDERKLDVHLLSKLSRTPIFRCIKSGL